MHVNLRAPVLAFDLETSGTNPFKCDHLLGVSVSDGERSEYLAYNHLSGNDARVPFEDLIGHLNAADLLIGHNLLFDLSFMVSAGLNVDSRRIWDTMTAAWLLDENGPLALKKLGVELLDSGSDDEQQTLKRLMRAHCGMCLSTNSKLKTIQDFDVYVPTAPGGKVGRPVTTVAEKHKVRVCKVCESQKWELARGWGELLPHEIRDYAAKDAQLTFDLYRWQRAKTAGDDEWQAVFNREMAVLQIVLEMTVAGVRIDLPRAREGADGCAKKTSEIEAWLPVNLRSPLQLRKWLYEDIGLKAKGFTPTGDESTNLDALLPHQKNKSVAKILEHRTFTKLGQFFETLVDQTGQDGKIHPRWRPTGTVSGRFSCSDPNFQNLPRGGGVRECLIAEPGHVLLSADLSQAELRVAAAYSKCVRLLGLFEAEADVYQTVADELGTDRQTAKTIVLSSLYGVGARKMRLILLRNGIDMPEKQVKAFLYGYFDMFPELRRFSRQAEHVAQSRGFVRLWIPGRVRRFPDGHWKANPKDAINSIVQGAVGELMKSWALATRERGLELGIYPVMQVHDSLTWMVPDGLQGEWEQFAALELLALNPFRVPLPANFKEGL